MLAADFISNLFTPQGAGQVFSYMFLAIVFLYLLFTLIFIRRVDSMNSSLKTEAGLLFKFLSYGHFIGALIVFIITLLLI